MTDAVSWQSGSLNVYSGSSDQTSGVNASGTSGTSTTLLGQSSDSPTFADTYTPSTSDFSGGQGASDSAGGIDNLYALPAATPKPEKADKPKPKSDDDAPQLTDVKQIFSHRGKAFSELYNLNRKKPFGPPPAPENPNFDPLAAPNHLAFYRVQVTLNQRAAALAYGGSGG